MLRQDTGMYEARASASENMLQAMRTLEAGELWCGIAGNLECVVGLFLIKVGRDVGTKKGQTQQ